MYATGSLFGCSPTALDAPAAAVECIHAYSLLHDDLPAMDDDDLRRGQPTCHIKFGEAHAILAGDALQTLAFSILTDGQMPGVADRDRLQMLSELAHASGVAGMCGGQALDLEAEGRHVALAALEQIHRHKTGALIRCAVRMGATAGGALDGTPFRSLTATLPPSVWRSRYRMTFWMWWVTAVRPASARERINSWTKAPIQPCSAWIRRGRKPLRCWMRRCRRWLSLSNATTWIRRR